jgi:hypothetical protein
MTHADAAEAATFVVVAHIVAVCGSIVHGCIPPNLHASPC